MYVPEVPEEEVSNVLVLKRPPQEELPQGTVQVELKLEHLNQLQQVHHQFVFAEGGRVYM